MASATTWQLLPPDLAEYQISQVDLLMAMYPNDQEVIFDSGSRELLRSLRAYYEEGSNETFSKSPTVVILLTLVVMEPDDPSRQKALQLEIGVPFSWEGNGILKEAPKTKVRIIQPPWLNRASTAHLNSQIPQDSDDLFSTIQSVQDITAQQLEDISKNLENSQNQPGSGLDGEPLVRVWFYFPSISTRSKRDDFIIHAPLYHLTGFLYAGKPGLLCVEGSSQNIDDYMKFIKTESWGDIPAHHKKVSERYREKNIQTRVFRDMQEITDSVGERRGQRANRGDMKAVEGWLAERGLGDAFTKVLM